MRKRNKNTNVYSFVSSNLSHLYDAIDMLTDEEFDFLIYAHNGDIINNRIELAEEELKTYEKIKTKIIMNSRSINRRRSVLSSDTSIYNSVSSFIATYIPEALKHLEESERNFLLQVHNGDLNNNRVSLEDNDLICYFDIKNKLLKYAKELYRNEKKPRSITSRYSKYTVKQIVIAASLLNDEYQDTLRSVYGSSLFGTYSPNRLSEEEIKKLSKAHAALKKKVEEVRIEEERAKGNSNLYEKFHNYEINTILEVFNSLPAEQRSILIKAYGEDLSESLAIPIKPKENRLFTLASANMIIRLSKKPKKKLTKGSRKNMDSVSNLHDIPYRDLSKREEIKLIKLSKLSFYDEVSDEERVKYAQYFMEYEPWFKDIMGSDLPEEEKRKALNEAIRLSFEYRNQFILNNIRLIYKFSYRGSNIPLDDLIQEGVFGLITALKKFDVKRGTSFGTYAINWIKSKTSRYVENNDKSLRLPSHVQYELQALDKANDTLTTELGREPSVSELALYMNKSVKEVQNIMKKRTTVTSLEKPIYDEDIVLGDTIVDENSDYVDDINQSIVNEEFRHLVMTSGLSGIEMEVILKRYGFNGQVETLKKIGEDLGLSKSRINQVELTALRKLRNDPNICKFMMAEPSHTKK